MHSAKLMKAATVGEIGGSISVGDHPRPAPAPGQVLVRVHASGVNPLDLKIRAGSAPHARHPLPAVLGIDLAGTIEAVGADVTFFRPGDAVYGLGGGVGGLQGTLARYVAVDQDLVAHKPASLSMHEAAALPLVSITAWEGLVEKAKVRPGDRVLVIGGAGGVGHLAVQIALARGARVSATASLADHAYLEALGAVPIDRGATAQEIVSRHAGGEGFDIVYDTVGGASIDLAFQTVRNGGHSVSCLGWSSHALAPLSFRSATYSGVFTLAPLLTGRDRARQGQILRDVARIVDHGHIRPRIDANRFNLDGVDAAHALVASGKADGKAIVDIITGQSAREGEQ